MKAQKQILLLVLLSFPICFLASTKANAQAPRDPKNVPATRLDKPSKNSGPNPRADYGRPSTESVAEQIRRRSRETRRRNIFPPVTDPGKLVEDQQETTAIRIEDYVYVETSDPSYPASISAAVVIGTVLDAKGFVSDDRTYVYSDYQIQVDDILKQDTAAKLVVGRRLVASRTGAAVYFTSGHITHYVTLGRGQPKVGKQYLFFLLRPDPDIAEYDICYGAAYELSDGRALPLDDEHHYRGLEDADASRLIKKIRDGITSSPK